MYATEPFIVIGNWHHISKRNDILGLYLTTQFIIIIFHNTHTHKLCRVVAFIYECFSFSIFLLSIEFDYKYKYRCSGCDTLFPSLMLLEHHKEEFEHWSDDEDDQTRPPCCRRNRDDDYTDTDSFTSEAESEDLERLL